jgi:hypothetical protein
MLDLERQLSIAFQERRHAGPKRHSSASAVLFRVLLALLKQVRMQAETRVNQKNSIVERADLNRSQPRVE